MINADYHTHSTYCDGKNALEEMVEGALNKGLFGIGFTGHSHTSFDEAYCMSEEDTKNYIKDIDRLKEKYKGKIEVYLGIELDKYSDLKELSPYDYIISSVHYVFKNGNYLPVDEDEDLFKYNIEKYYGGDVYSFCEDYYKEVMKLAKIPYADIIAHIDLVTKFNEVGKLFDIQNERYIKAENEALYALAAENKILEINTGAMSRGYRNEPYPSRDILKKWKKLGGRVILSGDAHSVDGLCYKFDFAEEIAKCCGFKTVTVFKNGEMAEIDL